MSPIADDPPDGAITIEDIAEVARILGLEAAKKGERWRSGPLESFPQLVRMRKSLYSEAPSVTLRHLKRIENGPAHKRAQILANMKIESKAVSLIAFQIASQIDPERPPQEALTDGRVNKLISEQRVDPERLRECAVAACTDIERIKKVGKGGARRGHDLVTPFVIAWLAGTYREILKEPPTIVEPPGKEPYSAFIDLCQFIFPRLGLERPTPSSVRGYLKRIRRKGTPLNHLFAQFL